MIDSPANHKPAKSIHEEVNRNIDQFPRKMLEINEKLLYLC